VSRDLLLVWYSQHERILPVDELDRILAKHRQDPRRLVDDSRTFWRNVDRAAPEDIRRFRTFIRPSSIEAHCDMVRRWRHQR
jgi:hypothetical protein